MTGSDAWSIVAPILASHMHHFNGSLDALDEAYVLVFGALREHDERKEEKNDNRKGEGRC